MTVEVWDARRTGVDGDPDKREGLNWGCRVGENPMDPGRGMGTFFQGKV